MTLQAWDRIGVTCVAAAVPKLRRVRGLRASPEEASDALGDRRRYRCLAEAVVAVGSPMEGMAAHEAGQLSAMQQTAVWAVRYTARESSTLSSEAGTAHVRQRAPTLAPEPDLTPGHIPYRYLTWVPSLTSPPDTSPTAT